MGEDKKPKFNFTSRLLVYYFVAVVIILGIIIAHPFSRGKSEEKSKELGSQADTVAEEDTVITQDVQSSQETQETIDESEPDADPVPPEIEPEEVSEPSIKDYFVKSRLVEGNEGQYKFSDYSEDIDRLVDDYHYFDFYHFATEYLGNNTKVFYDRSIGDDSLHLTAEQSPLGNPTTVLRDDLGWIFRIIIDKENKVQTLEDSENYIDLYTRMRNDGSFYTCIIVCRNGAYYINYYIDELLPDNMVFNASSKSDIFNSDAEGLTFLFIAEKDALKSLLKMAEKDVIFSDENPFEAIGDEWEELESYNLFVEDNTEG